MPKAIRFKHNGQYLQNTLSWTSNSNFLGAYHGVETDAIFNAELAAEEEQATIESHKQDYAIAFGVPAGEIECEVIAWDGDDATLPIASDSSAPVQRLPVEPAPEPEATPLAQALAALAADPNLSDETKDALAAISGGADVSVEIPMTPMKG